MGISRRKFIKNVGCGVAGLSVAKHSLAFDSLRDKGDSESLLVKNPDHPKAATVDRLPLEWYKKTVARLREKAGERGVHAIVLQGRWNLVYFTGLFHSTTERPFYAVIPVDENALYWYHPGLDRDMVKSWWSTDNAYYFDYLHAESGYPNLGMLDIGHRVDLFEWLLQGLKARGYGEKTIGFDTEFPLSVWNQFGEILPKAKMDDISDICLKMRMVKTEEEIALTQRAMDYFSKIHAFAREYLLEKGTDTTDFAIGRAAEEFGVNMIMDDVKRDGKPHNAVGISVQIGCRTGVATAYPHPNQFFHKKVEKGDALQISGVIRIGGYGGECYRYYQIEPWDEHRQKLWQIVTDCVHIQEKESKAGRTCAEVAYMIHKYQVQNGVSKYIYHRPAHGEGMEGHQAPWLALGDTTALEEGMTFSVEPGLYDPENGFGYNPSDNLLVTKEKGVLMSSVPYSKEWMILKL